MTRFSHTVTLTASSTKYTLLALMNAALDAASETNIDPTIVAEMNVIADGANDANNPIYWGDPATVSSIDYGIVLGPSDTYHEGSGNMITNIQTGDIAVISAASGQKLHIEAKLI